MKRTASANATSKSRGSSARGPAARLPRLDSPDLRFVVCVKTGGYVDLEPLKVYRVKRDTKARAHRLLRVIDGSGEDYLFPAAYFRPIAAPAGLFGLVEP